MVLLANEIKEIDKPTYVTSPKAEIKQVTGITKNVNPKFVTHFIPTVDDFLASKTLWKSVNGHETYWTSLEKFLKNVAWQNKHLAALPVEVYFESLYNKYLCIGLTVLYLKSHPTARPQLAVIVG